MKIKGPGKVLLFAILAVGLFFGGKWFLSRPKTVGDSQTVGKITIPDAPEASLQGTAATKLELPTKSVSGKGEVKAVWNEMAWNSHLSQNYANGGVRTTKGSLLEKAGWDIEIKRQDDCIQSCTDMIKYINDYKNGATKDGFFITFMATGMPNYLRVVSEAVKALGAEYQPVLFLTTGKSYGEDKLVGDVKYKGNAPSLRGCVVHGVRLDGDLDLAIKLGGDNGVPINADEKLYYPDAINLSYAKDYLQAVVDYNQNLQQTRKIVRNGKTGADTTVGIDIVATWTPGDVNAANGRGGVSIISTKEYASVMPNVTMTCRKFLNDNRTAVENMIAAFAQAGDQVRSFDDVKKYACSLNALIWNEQSADYWYKYYNGVKQGNTQLGGSMVFNLSDMANIFGLNGGADIYKEVYNTFGKKQSQLYPKDLPNFVDYSKAVDKSFLLSVVSNHPELMEGKALVTDYSNDITTTVASKDVHINFEFGSANISASSYPVLNEIYSSAITAEGLKVGVYGYTDNVGNPESNRLLSERRAQAVRDYLVKKGVKSVRLEVKGFGEEQPVSENTTEAGRAANRRVQILLGN